MTVLMAKELVLGGGCRTPVGKPHFSAHLVARQHARASDKSTGALSTSGGTEGACGASELSPRPGLAAAPRLQVGVADGL